MLVKSLLNKFGSEVLDLVSHTLRAALFVEIVLSLIFDLNLVWLAIKLTLQVDFFIDLVQREKYSAVMEIDAINLLNLILNASKHLVDLPTTELRVGPDLEEEDIATG